MLKSGVRSAPLRLAKPDLKTIDDIFEFFGPTPRLCFDKFRKPDDIERYRQTIKTALRELKPHELQTLVENSGNLSADKISHKICLITRNDQVRPSDDVADVTPITDFVKSQLVICLRNLQIKEQVQLYNQFSKVPSARGMTGVLFEAYCQLRFQKMISLVFIPMVRLPDPTTIPRPRPTKKQKVVQTTVEERSLTRRPQWHSSHVTLPGELEKLRELALPAAARLEVSPCMTYEYDASKPLHIRPDVYYLPKQDNQVVLDSFILHDNLLHIFQFTGGKRDGINDKLLLFFDKSDGVPARSDWRFIFVIPHDVAVAKCPASLDPEIMNLRICSSIVPIKENI